MKTRAKTLTGFALVAGLALAAGIVWATATETPIAGNMNIVWLGDPERSWLDEEGIQHWRNQPGVFAFVSGDIQGTGTFLANGNLDPVTGDGDGFGQMTIDASLGELSGTFEGRFSETFTNFQMVAQFVGDGTGDFAGMKAIVPYTGVILTMGRAYEGIILDPQGE